MIFLWSGLLFSFGVNLGLIWLLRKAQIELNDLTARVFSGMMELGPSREERKIAQSQLKEAVKQRREKIANPFQDLRRKAKINWILGGEPVPQEREAEK